MRSDQCQLFLEEPWTGGPAPNPTIPGRPALHHLGALLIFTLLSIAATWPMFPQLAVAVTDKGDPLYSIWAMAWQAHALCTHQRHERRLRVPVTKGLAGANLACYETFHNKSLRNHETEAEPATAILWHANNDDSAHHAIHGAMG